MATTPHHLVVRHGLPKHTASRKVWRAWMAFNNREKRKEFLSVAWVMQMAGAIEQYGAPPAEVERRSQRLMASMLGIDISTFNRRLGQFSAPDGRWDDERRRRHSEMMKLREPSRHQDAGPPGAPGHNQASKEMENLRPVSRKAHRQVQRLVTLFNKNAGYGQAQLYSLRMPQQLKPQMEKKGEDRTKDAALLAQAFGSRWFDSERRGVNGFKAIPGWVWDPHLPDVDKCECQSGQMGLPLAVSRDCHKCNGRGDKCECQSGQMGLPLAVSRDCHKCNGRGYIVYSTPLPDYGRVLLTFLLLKGLEQYGSVEITQEAIGDALGMDVNTVAKYEDKLEALMIIRCVAGEVTRDAAGAVVDRKPHKIIWLPDRMLDEDIAEREWQRFQDLRSQVADREALRRAEGLHVALLKAWRGKEHSLSAFWNELRRQFARAGISQSVSDALLPVFRE